MALNDDELKATIKYAFACGVEAANIIDFHKIPPENVPRFLNKRLQLCSDNVVALLPKEPNA